MMFINLRFNGWIYRQNKRDIQRMIEFVSTVVFYGNRKELLTYPLKGNNGSTNTNSPTGYSLRKPQEVESDEETTND